MYVPVDDRGFRMAMGLRPLDLANWLEVDEHRERELALKRDLLATKRSTVVATLPIGEAASGELHTEVIGWLARHQPTLDRTVDASEHPIVSAARLVQEDLCVLVHTDAWRLVAAAVCFPSRWMLAEKIGTTLDQIHGPIPGYDEELSGPTRSVFDRMRPERSFWRLNWTLLDSGELHQSGPARASVETPVPEWFFRVERQTLRRLPVSDAIVFTIHNYVTPLSAMIGVDGFAENLLRAMAEAPPAMQRYKGWVGVAERLRTHLADLA